jgi:transcriptional regulator with XRE-family HTH domain
LSLSDVAVKAGLSVATLSRIETGKQNVDVTLLLNLARILRVSPSALLETVRPDGDGVATPNLLADELAALPAAERARVVISAQRQSRREGVREALHTRVESLLTTLDLIRDELLQVRKDLRRGR